MFVVVVDYGLVAAGSTDSFLMVRGLHDDAPTYLKSKTLSFRMVQCIAKMRLDRMALLGHPHRKMQWNSKG